MTPYIVTHDPTKISMDGAPDVVVGVSVIFNYSDSVRVRSLAWAMRPSELRFELLALRNDIGLLKHGWVWAGVSYDRVIDDATLNGNKVAEDNLVSYLMTNSKEIVGRDLDEMTWRSLVKAVMRVGLSDVVQI